MKTVSIVVPVYKVEPYLERCVESLLAQTHKDLEIILVDDGSPDRCGEICDSYAARYSHISVIHKENGGLSSARLAGFRQASGEYILFIDSDDYVKKEMVETLYAAMEDSGADMAMCSYYVDNRGVITEHIIESPSKIIKSDRIAEDYIYRLIGSTPHEENIPAFLWLRMMKRSLIQESCFVDENKYFSEDIVFNMEYARKISSICLIKQPLYIYCVNADSLTTKYRKNVWEMGKQLYLYMLNYEDALHAPIPPIRKKNYIISCIIRTINNAAKAGGHASFRREMETLVNDVLAQKIIQSMNETPQAHLYKMLFSLIRYKLYWLIYLIKSIKSHTVL